MVAQKAKALGSKADHGSDKDETLPPYYKPILKRNHAEHEQFNAKSFPFDELIPRWKGDKFDPNFMNAGTGRPFTKIHHIKGEGPKKRVDLERFSSAFCLEFIDRIIDPITGETVRDRCYNMFNLKSPGCYDHPKATYKEGSNRVYYSMVRGEVCTWAMLKDPQAPVPEGRKAWTYVEWLNYATDIAQEERDQALKEEREDYEEIIPARLAEFEAWWRIEVKKDAQKGGAQAANTRGFSLKGTFTPPPDFMARHMARQTSLVGLPNGTRPLNVDPLPAFSQLKPNIPTSQSSPRIATNRRRFGQGDFGGRPELEAKRKANQQAKNRKTITLPEKGNDDFFSGSKRERKPRHGNTSQGRQNTGAA
jgi:hypothetical protein